MQHGLPVVAELNGEWVLRVSQRLGEGAGGQILRQAGDLDLFLAIGDNEGEHRCTRHGVDIDGEGDGTGNGEEGGGEEDVHDDGRQGRRDRREDGAEDVECVPDSLELKKKGVFGGVGFRGREWKFEAAE